VQHSSDGSSWTDLVTFSLANATTSTSAATYVRRTEVTGAVKERLRANLHKLSASDSIRFAVAFARNPRNTV